MQNPLLERSDLPLYAQIKPEHVTPAIDLLLSRSREGFEEILKNSNANYVELVEKSYKLFEPLTQAWGAISHLNHVVNSDELRDAYNENLPKISNFFTELSQNKAYYELYKNIETQSLRPDQAKALENEILGFELSGVALEGAERDRCKELIAKLSELNSAFSDAVLDGTMAWTKNIKNKEELKGLPDSTLELLKQNAKQRDQENYLLTLEFPSYLPLMLYCDNRDLRKEVCIARQTIASEIGPNAGEFDNSQRMEDIMTARQELAKLLGFENASELSLKKKMAKNTTEVLKFLNDLVERSSEAAKKEVQELIDFAKEKDGLTELKAWDLMYYKEKLKERDYQISDEELKPYFPIEKVTQGMFNIVSELFDLEISKVQNTNSWHEDVQFYEIKRQGQQVARFFLDPFARQHKQGGAWMDSCKSRKQLQGEDFQTPVAYLICNFTPPIGDKPSLLTHDEVTTLFHEFGHGLHHMLSTIDEPNVSGISGVAWDAVELPSQFLENWCWQRKTIPLISSHYESGEPLPESLLNKLLKAKNFQSASMMLRQLEFSLFDFRLHIEYGTEQFESIKKLIQEVREKTAVIPTNPENRFQNSFSHIFAGGYDAGYYSYKWAEVLSADAFSKFEEEGIMNKATGQCFLDELLSQGGSKDAADLFEAFRGRPPKIDALLKHSGIA